MIGVGPWKRCTRMASTVRVPNVTQIRTVSSIYPTSLAAALYLHQAKPNRPWREC